MSVTLKIKRGKESDRLNYTPQEGELIITTDNLELFVGDGSTAGGIKVDSNTFIKITEKAAANGVATLDSNGKIPTNQLPALSIMDVVVCDNEDDQVNSNTQVGDICVRTDESKTYIRTSTDNNNMDDWTELLFPDAVTSVNGMTGNVTLGLKDLTDIDDNLNPNDQDVLVYDGSNSKWVTAAKDSVGRTTFTGLDDTPASYDGQAGKYAIVNDDETAIEFTSIIDGGLF